MCFFSGDGVCCAAVCFVEEGWCVVVTLWCLDVLCGGACDVWWWCGVSWCVVCWRVVVDCVEGGVVWWWRCGVW